MEETTIYIETPLTPKILEGLDDERRYAVIFSDGGEDFYTKSGILQYIKFVDDVVKITNILLPVKVTKDMVEKEADKSAGSNYFKNHHPAVFESRKAGFIRAINWLLNIKEDNK